MYTDKDSLHNKHLRNTQLNICPYLRTHSLLLKLYRQNKKETRRNKIMRNRSTHVQNRGNKKNKFA